VVSDRLVMITVCSTGIGRAMAVEVLRRGDRAVVTARRPESVADLPGDRGLTLRLDVTDVPSIERAVAAARGWCRRRRCPPKNCWRGCLARSSVCGRVVRELCLGSESVELLRRCD